ncbi:MAG: N-acetylmuramic acid 6-phosphate etherase, partial [Erysipelothrix sp.]|nr:N-acetylmuramic acid 6-phosphate etherase [Erysipelothrix sp.]
DYSIEIEVGPEVLTGSTRLKSGTAQKLVLNMITTTAMVLTGKVYQNLMVNVQMSNEKLEVRAQNIVMESTGVSRDLAKEMISLANNDVKLAIVMILTGLNADEATTLLNQNKGHVKATIRKMEERKNEY